MTDVVLAVDGGNSKTHLALVDATGALMALVRGPGSSPHYLTLPGCLEVLTELRARALADAGLTPDTVAAAAQVMVAGADLPDEEAALHAALEATGWARRVTVANDTFALLRAGSDRGWGVAVVCGAGTNCVGRDAAGRDVRFLALGATTGDWGGGSDVGLAALSAAARSADGRGPQTVLERLVPQHFGLGTPLALAEALHRHELLEDRLVELAPLVLEASAYDSVCRGVVERVADEVVAFARVALQKLDLQDIDPHVVLGGGLLAAGNALLLARVRAGVLAVCPGADIRVVSAPPILGAALLALTHVGAGAEAHERLRAGLTSERAS